MLIIVVFETEQTKSEVITAILFEDFEEKQEQGSNNDSIMVQMVNCYGDFSKQWIKELCLRDIVEYDASRNFPYSI
jgi:hypothetical protein